MMYMSLKMNYGKQILLPSIPEVLKEVDLENERVIVHLIDGLR